MSEYVLHTQFATEAGDVLDQQSLGLSDWDGALHGLGGDDTISVMRFDVVGGPGNDRIEWLPGGAGTASYFDAAPVGALVDLEAGWAHDGWGTVDTLINARGASGSGRDDTLLGSAGDDWLNPSGGVDLIDGRGGRDQVGLEGAPDDYDVRVSADGREAVVTRLSGGDGLYTLVDVESLNFWGSGQTRALTDFLTRDTEALQTLIASPSARWNSDLPLGSAVELTFSFMAQAPDYGDGGAGTGFFALDEAQRDAVRAALAQIAGPTAISFTEVVDGTTTYGEMRFGINQQTDTTGYSFLPNDPLAGPLAGDVWLDVETALDLSPGSAGFARLVHEIGHALGLRHPGNDAPGDDYAMTLRAQSDGQWLTVMSHHDHVQGLQREGLGLLDLVALRTLYGSTSVHSADDVVRLDDSIGTRLSLLVDDGGHDRIDASGLSAGVFLDLRGGELSSVGRTADGHAAIDNLSIAWDSLFEDANGTAFDDVLRGNAAPNRLAGAGGNDSIDGGSGIDTAVFEQGRDAYAVARLGDDIEVTALDGVSGVAQLTSVERLVFGDGGLAFDLDGAAGNTARLIGAAFGTEYLQPDLSGIGIAIFDAGFTLGQVAEMALATPLFLQVAGSRSDADVVDALFTHVVGVAPTTAEAAPFVQMLAGGTSQADLLVLAATHPLNDLSIDLTGLSASGLAYAPDAIF